MSVETEEQALRFLLERYPDDSDEFSLSRLQVADA
jgi:hypothetical protein